jgi:transcriptional regulator with XRE-family HTH domain
LEELRVRAGLSKNRLAALAGIDRGTVRKAEEGQAIQDVKLAKILNALGKELGRDIGANEVTI